MKKLVTFFVILVSLLTFQITSYAAEPVAKTLDKADISIISDGESNYEIKQTIVLKGEGDFSGNQIEHTFSNINDIKPENLQFISEGNQLEFTVEEFESLDKYIVNIPSGVSGTFTYEISYTLSVGEGEYATPIFVPMHPADGQSNVVQIDFQTTEENMVQRNSFPVLKKAEDNEVTSYLMNIPAHVNYIFGPEKNLFNSHNIISWASILILLSIIFIWIRSELKSKNINSNNNNSKGVVN
ncbi:hypothetical protein [Bacillus sp. MRMR6]|uniref:hypothetical protein n=1 Tax=Bacillus sp. MRMR6 TaxID=1928617 RepID=UPI00095231B5|nr:hypothetical protein [Bacillus sp. MRMR6]OLS37310.1 hypothetical protein BTR25_16255 [Bacillus sp. MRMR6]